VTQFRSDAAYILNNEIVAEAFDDETVLIDVDRGIYFSMQGTAASVWRAFDVPRTPDAACAELAADLPEAGREMVSKLIQDLAEQKLIVATERPPANPGKPLDRFVAASFVAPVFGVFTDLADLIGIDPVHEVDESAGWPVRPASPNEVT
jgi:hypothetical protein